MKHALSSAWRHKYHARPASRDGHRFASKAEAKRYDELKLLHEVGDVVWFTWQCPVRLPGGIKYVVDFLVLWRDGRVTFEDVKGFRTEQYKTKRRLVRSAWGIEITELQA